ncbi:Crp/Fnr family transcriptional regulator [Gorillibacterium sp. CAU 1737]|uniref:Crp/Fnr family transcriptional regulator n=1 Tax=Gorillibacterium sp. CAU 1737 TaxID=3140362 RepID=UPI003260CE5C
MKKGIPPHNCQEQSTKACVLRVPIFNHLEPHQLDEIMSATRSVGYTKGELINRAGDPSDMLSIVNAGKVKIYRLSESGKEQLVRILAPGDFSGELALFRESVHESYSVAMEDTQICTITRPDLQAFLLKYPTIALKILAEFSRRLEASEKQTTLVSTEKVEKRLALYLIECLEQEGAATELTLPMSKKNLASYLGTTPETISRKLVEFENAGFIRQKARRRIEILNLDGLRAGITIRL